MKKSLVKVNKSIKIIGGILAFFISAVTVWGFIEKFSSENIAGEWYLEFKVEESSYRPYIGETHTQKIFFVQSDNKLSGNGEKWEYNGKLLDFSMHRKLEYVGTIEGSDLKLKYILHGRDRVTEGMITAEIHEDGKTMVGVFSGTAANSRGSVKGKKQ